MAIEVNKLKEFLNCDNDFLAELMKKLMEDIDDSVSKINDANQKCDYTVLRAVSHKMLSSVRIFNLNEISEVLEKIEEYSEKNINTEQIPSLVAALNTLCSKTKIEIQNLLPTLI